MAKKTHLKVRMVPESNPDSKFIYYAKKPTKGEKVKDKLKLKKYNPNTRKHEFSYETRIWARTKFETNPKIIFGNCLLALAWAGGPLGEAPHRKIQSQLLVLLRVAMRCNLLEATSVSISRFCCR